MSGFKSVILLTPSALRPPVEETTSFLSSVLDNHGPNYLEILLGPKARNNLKQLGGVENVAIVLSGNGALVCGEFGIKVIIAESRTIRDLADALHLTWRDLAVLRSVFKWIKEGDSEMLMALGVKVRL